MENKISFKITAAQKQEIGEAIENLANKIQLLLMALEMKDKKWLAKISDKSVPFMDRAIQYMKTNAEFVPSFVNVEHTENDYSVFTDLRAFLHPVAQISGSLDDTAVRAGNEAWRAALAYYNQVKSADKQGVPNARAIYEDLRTHFEQQREKTAADSEM